MDTRAQILVETGVGFAEANAYCSVDNLRRYCANRGIAVAGSATDYAARAALISATDYLERTYGHRYSGKKQYRAGLSWPRIGVVDGDWPTPSNCVPNRIIVANAMLAVRVLSGESLDEDVGPRVVREKLDTIEVEYATTGAVSTTKTDVEKLLSPVLRHSGGSSVTLQRA